MSHRDDATAQSIERESLNTTARIILDKALIVHSRLGPGLLESVYRTCLTHELRTAGQKVVSEQLAPIVYDGMEYLKLLDKRLGLLINFKVPQVMQGVKRIVNNF